MLGPFEEEEEGTGITSDVVKVKGEDPVTPGLLSKGIDPGTVTIPQYRVNKTKQHTHESRQILFFFRGFSQHSSTSVHARVWTPVGTRVSMSRDGGIMTRPMLAGRQRQLTQVPS